MGKRFEMSISDGKPMIRVVQGHSIKAVKDDAVLKRVELSDTLPEKCVHGTYVEHFYSIISKGLLVGGLGQNGSRNHIHFAAYDVKDKQVISGMRASCDLAVYHDLRRAMKAGMQFFMSKNEVILTQGENGAIPSKYFQSVVNIKSGKVLFQAPSGKATKVY